MREVGSMTTCPSDFVRGNGMAGRPVKEARPGRVQVALIWPLHSCLSALHWLQAARQRGAAWHSPGGKAPAGAAIGSGEVHVNSPVQTSFATKKDTSHPIPSHPYCCHHIPPLLAGFFARYFIRAAPLTSVHLLCLLLSFSSVSSFSARCC